MCGICGIVNAPAEAGANAATVTTMTEDLERRGPDASGSWTSPDGATSLGFRRLAIIDPTPAGAQPMWSADGDAVLVFNGEIYNHPELRRELERDGHRFRSSSDTEVLLEGLRRWDTELLPRLRGMFALALYRPETGSLLLARDHAGIKPLFFARAPGGTGVAFSSRYDSLFRTGWLDPDRFRPDALAEYVARRHVGRSAALHEHAAQVGPGEWVRIGADGRESRRTWWRLEAPSDPDLRGEEAVEATKSVIDTAVRRHLLSDVPVGVFLSGGVDSPLVAGTATDLADRRYDGFTVGYPGWDQDETAAAGRMAEPLRIDHHVRAVTGAPADTVPAVMAAQDEPVNDWSIVPTLLVSEAARSKMTVALSGDGGDELFFGYVRSWSLAGSWRLWRLPRLARRAVNKAKRTVGRRTWGAVEHPDPTAYYDAMQSSAPPEVLARVAPGLVDSFGARRPPGLDGGLDLRSLAWFSQRREFEFQLPRILRKVDQASMHHSLEVRVPLLDPDVIATALRVDPAWTLRQTGTKPVLRRLLDDRLGFAAPRPKLGFGAPMGEWMATDLREPIDDVLRHGLDTDLGLATDEVERCWRAQLSGEADHRMLLWGLACLGWWRGRVRSMTP